MKSKWDWSGLFMTMSLKMKNCTSEEDMYLRLKSFKDEFNSEYGSLSRMKRLKNGFREE